MFDSPRKYLSLQNWLHSPVVLAVKERCPFHEMIFPRDDF